MTSKTRCCTSERWIRTELSDTVEESRNLNRDDNLTSRPHAAVIKACLALPDLAGVRDAAALARLPADEAREWSALWQEAASVLGPPRPKTWTLVPPPPPAIDDPPAATQKSVWSGLLKKK